MKGPGNEIGLSCLHNLCLLCFFQDRQQRDILTVRERLEELEENQKNINDLLGNSERPTIDLGIS